MAATQVVSQGELVLVAEHVAFPPEQLHKLGEARVILNKKYEEISIAGGYGLEKKKRIIFLCKVLECLLKLFHIVVSL